MLRFDDNSSSLTKSLKQLIDVAWSSIALLIDVHGTTTSGGCVFHQGTKNCALVEAHRPLVTAAAERARSSSSSGGRRDAKGEEESWPDAWRVSRGDNVGTSVLRPACSPLVEPWPRKPDGRISVSYSRGGRSRPVDLLLCSSSAQPTALLMGSTDRVVVARITLDTTARDVFTAIVAFHPLASLLSFVASFFLFFFFFLLWKFVLSSLWVIWNLYVNCVGEIRDFAYFGNLCRNVIWNFYFNYVGGIRYFVPLTSILFFFFFSFPFLFSSFFSCFLLVAVVRSSSGFSKLGNFNRATLLDEIIKDLWRNEGAVVELIQFSIWFELPCSNETFTNWTPCKWNIYEQMLPMKNDAGKYILTNFRYFF